MMGHHPVLMLSQNTKRESGRKIQSRNINAAKTIADIIWTCLGPKSMMKMLLDPTGGIIQVQHPAAKSMIEISRTQDEEVGDGITSVIILTGEMLSMTEHFLEQQMHPTVVIGAYHMALDDVISTLKKISIPVDVNNHDMMLNIINSSIITKVISRWSSLVCNIALDAFEENGQKEIDIKSYERVEKIPGGIIEDSCVLRGVMINKDVTHPRVCLYIKNPGIVLLNSSLEYKKRETVCEDIIQLKPDVVIITEKGISDLANVTAIHRVGKTANNPIARACGARIELREEDVGTGTGLLEIKKIGDEYVTFITECKDPKACTILLRGASEEILSDVEPNLQDAMQVCQNILLDPQLVPGGGASEMAIAHALTEKSKAMTGVEQWPYRAVAQALEVIPHTLIQNCGVDLLTSLRAKHTQQNCETWRVNGETGTLVDTKELGIWEPMAKTAVETAVLLLWIDGIVSGHKKEGDDQSPQSSAPDAGQQ
uniref:T-complex protein 1 subunit gamma n=1 Tax=Cricetulus griseus TaxID=10029 RepID=A0A8C2QHV0_CRIGR